MYIKVKDIMKIVNKLDKEYEEYGGFDGMTIHYNSSSDGFGYLSVSFQYNVSHNFGSEEYEMEISEFFDRTNLKYWDEIQSDFAGYKLSTIYGDYEDDLFVENVINYCFERRKGFPIINFYWETDHIIK